MSILSSFDTLPTTPLKEPWANDLYLGYFTWPRVHLLTYMLSFACPPEKSKSTLGPCVTYATKHNLALAVDPYLVLLEKDMKRETLLMSCAYDLALRIRCYSATTYTT